MALRRYPLVMASLRVLFIGEIVGKSGVWVVKELLPKMRQEQRIDFVIADGEGATGGFGIGKNHAVYLHKLGIDAITTGECSYYKKDIVEHFNRAPYMIRPANYPPKQPGPRLHGLREERQEDRRDEPAGRRRVQAGAPEEPLQPPAEAPGIHHPETNAIILDFHAVTTAEKATMFAMADGKLSAVIGTHTKALTADDRVLAGRHRGDHGCGQDREPRLRGGAGPRDRDPQAHHARARVLQGSVGDARAAGGDHRDRR